jgi:hypothetical protein
MICVGTLPTQIARYACDILGRSEHEVGCSRDGHRSPFGVDGKLDFRKFEKLTIRLRAHGVKGCGACGSTGEYDTLTADERVPALKFVAEFESKRELVIAATNGFAIKPSSIRSDA